MWNVFKIIANWDIIDLKYWNRFLLMIKSKEFWKTAIYVNKLIVITILFLLKINIKYIPYKTKITKKMLRLQYFFNLKFFFNVDKW